MNVFCGGNALQFVFEIGGIPLAAVVGCSELRCMVATLLCTRIKNGRFHRNRPFCQTVKQVKLASNMVIAGFQPVVVVKVATRSIPGRIAGRFEVGFLLIVEHLDEQVAVTVAEHIPLHIST
jgi:hypothetical protein